MEGRCTAHCVVGSSDMRVWVTQKVPASSLRGTVERDDTLGMAIAAKIHGSSNEGAICPGWHIAGLSCPEPHRGHTHTRLVVSQRIRVHLVLLADAVT